MVLRQRTRTSVDVYSLVVPFLGWSVAGWCESLLAWVFSLQFHAGKRRDDILKDPGGSDGFSQTPNVNIISAAELERKEAKDCCAALLGIVHEHQHEEKCIYYFCGQFVLKQIDSSNTVPSSLVLAADRMMYVSELLLN
jgi:hypothetical protein